jgi:hypothetical protein
LLLAGVTALLLLAGVTALLSGVSSLLLSGVSSLLLSGVSTDLLSVVVVSTSAGTGILVGDLWLVSLFVGGVFYDLLPTVGKEDVVLALGALSLSLLFVTELYVVFRR